MAKYREWLAFDSFIFNDDAPIRAYDAQKTGQPEPMPKRIQEIFVATDLGQLDYDDIAKEIFRWAPDCPGFPTVRYSEVYQRYMGLSSDQKELIEWFVSFPPYFSLIYCRDRPFFNPTYWQIVHAIILIEQMVGSSDACSQSPKRCDCGSSLHPHRAVSRRDWVRQLITSRIGDKEIVEQYIRTIETGYEVRNQMAHSPQFDRSRHEAPLEQAEVYDISRAASEYRNNSAALKLLVTSLRDVARGLLLNGVFGIEFFRPLSTLTSFRVK